MVKHVEYVDHNLIIDYEDLTLDVYTDFSGLKFTIDSSMNLVLIEEKWCKKGLLYNEYNFIVGKPDEKTIKKVIDLYMTLGKKLWTDFNKLS